MAKLVGRRIVDARKIRDYLLNSEHPEGASKAEFFKAFGYSQSTSDELSAALENHAAAHEVFRTDHKKFGIHSVVCCAIVSPDGRNPCIVSVWIKDEFADEQRLVTAYPA